MKKTICRVTYDTEIAEVVLKRTNGSFGEPTGYEETLYRMPNGSYFVYVNGGAESPYPEEKITRLGKDKAQAWIAEHSV